MTQDEMWLAVSQNDASADGLFFYAVSSTGVFCRPSCKSRRPKRENVRYFKTAEQAMAAGFRPCKRCRSDLADYRPVRDIAEKPGGCSTIRFANGAILTAGFASWA